MMGYTLMSEFGSDLATLYLGCISSWLTRFYPAAETGAVALAILSLMMIFVCFRPGLAKFLPEEAMVLAPNDV